MIPFKVCPSCNSDFVRYNSGLYFLESCKKACSNSADYCKEHDCPIQFRQQYKDSFEGEISSFQFYTKHFHINYYTSLDGCFPNTTHIYTKHFPREANTMSPIFRIKDLVLNFNNLDELDKKYFTLSLFL